MNIHTDRLPGARRLRLLEQITRDQEQARQARASLANYQAAAATQPQPVATPQPVQIPGEPVPGDRC